MFLFKVNTKPAFHGDGWAWHQDFVAWRLLDNLPSPRLPNVGVFLDDVTEFNGPLIVLPGSHRGGPVRDGRNAEAASEEHLDPDDISLSPQQVGERVGTEIRTHPLPVTPPRPSPASYTDVPGLPELSCWSIYDRSVTMSASGST